MKLFRRFSTRSKVVFGAALLIAAITAIVALPSSGHALLGGDRETKEYTQGMAGFDHVQFDSFTNVPGVGDERQFLNGRMDGSNTPLYNAMNGVQSGDILEMQVYVHNNADSSLNASGAGVAKNTHVKVTLPTDVATTENMQAFISADNATPQTIESDFPVKGASNFGLAFVPGSASIKGNHIDAALSDNIVKDGVTIGSNALDGNYNGCFDYVGLITFKVKVVTPSFTIQKNVRKHGDTNWSPSVTAKSGDVVDFGLTFHNTGPNQLNNVIVGDRLPVGLTYVPNSTQYFDSTSGNKWADVTNDGWMSGGLALGNFAPDAAVYIKYSAKVDDASKLQCGDNRLTNFMFATAEGQSNLQASAEVDVTKTCTTPTPAPTTPSYSCDKFELDVDNASRTVTVKTFNTSAEGGANFKSVDLDWAENGVQALNTNTPVGKSHTYAVASGNGPFAVTATAHFSTPNSNDVTATSAKCVQQVSFTSATTAPANTVLPNTGAGNVVEVFAAATIAGALLHRLFLSRRLARR